MQNDIKVQLVIEEITNWGQRNEPTPGDSLMAVGEPGNVPVWVGMDRIQDLQKVGFYLGNNMVLHIRSCDGSDSSV